MQEFKCTGLWTLPNTETNPVAGTLSVSARGDLHLSLIGSFNPGEKPQPGAIYPVVNGFVNSSFGNEVTLTNCYLSSRTFWPFDRKFWSFDRNWEEYRAGRAFFGACIKNLGELVFRRVQIRIAGLWAWARTLSGFRQGDMDGLGIGKEAPLLQYAMANPAGGRIKNGEISLGFGLTSSSKMDGWVFSEKPSFIVTFDSALSEDEINQRFVFPLQNLLTFVSDRAREVEEISLWCHDIFTPTQDNPEIRLISARIFPEPEQEKSVFPNELLFTLSDLENGLAPFVERWFSTMAKYGEACNIFFGLKYGPPAYLDFIFMGVIESLCLFYMGTKGGHLSQERENKRFFEVVGKISSISSEDANWVRSYFPKGFFLPFHKILEKLLEEHAETMNPLLPQRQGIFINEVMHTFYYTLRRDPEDRQSASHGRPLFWLTEKLRILFKVCFLRELGFSVEKIKSFLPRDRFFRHLCEMNQQPIPAPKIEE